MRSTSTEWCDATFNPWWGCERVSPGCAHCYAATFAKRVGQNGLWSKGGDHGFRFFADAHWQEPLKWARTLPAKLGRRPRVFCASMADVFEERPELDEARVRLFNLIVETPELDWLVLTKRPIYAARWLNAYYWREVRDEPLPNVWMGVSIENARHNCRADVLRETPAAVRFISAEPLLGSLVSDERRPLDLTDIDWLIVGGESGHHARQLRLEWVRELLDHAGVLDHHRKVGRPAVFVKQLGAKPTELGVSMRVVDPYGPVTPIRDAKGGDMDEWPRDLRVREWPAISSQLVPTTAGGAA